MDVLPTAQQDELFELSHLEYGDFLPFIYPSSWWSRTIFYTVYSTQCTLVLLDGDSSVDTSVYKCNG